MINNFSVVVPIQNEANYIPYSFSSIFKLAPYEVVVVISNTTDKSEELIKELWKCSKSKTELRFFNLDDHVIDWNEVVGYKRRYGYQKCNNDIILATDGDMILDSKILNLMSFLEGSIKMLKFGFLDYPFNLKSFMRQAFATITPFKPYSGVYAFSKAAWLETENIEDAKKNKKGEDAHLQLAIERKYKSRYFNTRSLHLRTTETNERDRMRGKNYQSILNASFLRVFATSLFMLRPHMLIGYLEEGRKKNVSI